MLFEKSLDRLIGSTSSRRPSPPRVRTTAVSESRSPPLRPSRRPSRSGRRQALGRLGVGVRRPHAASLMPRAALRTVAALNELAKAADGGSRQVEYRSYGRTTVIAQPWSIAVLERLFVVPFEGDEAAVDREPTRIATTHRVDCGIVPTDPGRLRRGNEMLQIRAAWPIRPSSKPGCVSHLVHRDRLELVCTVSSGLMSQKASLPDWKSKAMCSRLPLAL